jgi:hypothetical protein
MSGPEHPTLNGGAPAPVPDERADARAHRFPGHHISEASVHTKMFGDGTRAPLPPRPAGPRIMTRRIPVKVRAPFLPDHHDAASRALKAHQDKTA